MRRLQAVDAVVRTESGLAAGAARAAGTAVFVANSMPVRDVEYVWPANDRALRPFCNRGANGIDGTLSTALGIAHGGHAGGAAHRATSRCCTTRTDFCCGRSCAAR